MNKILARQLHRAREEGRLCSQCGWIITIINWRKGYRLCGACFDANKEKDDFIKSEIKPYMMWFDNTVEMIENNDFKFEKCRCNNTEGLNKSNQFNLFI